MKGQPDPKGYSVLIRHPKQGGAYALKSKIEGLGGAARRVPRAAQGHAATRPRARSRSSSRRRRRLQITIWDGRVPLLLDALLRLPNLDAAARTKLEPLVRLRREIGRIDTEVEGPRAPAGRARPARERDPAEPRGDQEGLGGRRSAQQVEQAPRRVHARRRQDRAARIVELQSKRLEKKIELEDSLQSIDLSAPTP